MYQVPSSPSGESFDVPAAPLAVETSKEEVGRQSLKITREEIALAYKLAYNKNQQDLEMSIAGFEDRTLPDIELSKPHPIAMEIGKIAIDLQERRYIYLEYLINRAKSMGFAERALLKMKLSPKDRDFYFRPTLDKIIDRESEFGKELFEHDADVTEIKFFLHQTEWFHQQQSSRKEKNFTNKYETTEHTILKSSSFYSPHVGEVTRTVHVDDHEARNLLIASRKYYEKSTGSVYIKTPAPRLRFGTKSNHDLAA